jgi:hypothetical protein
LTFGQSRSGSSSFPWQPASHFELLRIAFAALLHLRRRPPPPPECIPANILPWMARRGKAATKEELAAKEHKDRKEKTT